MDEDERADVVPLDPRARQVQHRTVGVLGTAQVFSGLGNGATLSLGSILAVDLSGVESTAGLVNTGMTLGSAVVSILLAQLGAGHRAGDPCPRRPVPDLRCGHAGRLADHPARSSWPTP